ncbi:chain length determinant family protein BpsA (plasmid) [Bacillus tropicus]|uniref:chain length determinant family protein BpsA n=1 Tax=Bacillus TaxID=1386 RepID=UPI001035F0B2|nr:MULTISPECIES: chain length determinant family protein BpsA [Bacillus]WBO93062.1 chain length determinant family protein BpsA [Bacillus tropicus]
MERIVGLREIMAILQKYFKLIIFTTLLAGAISSIISFYVVTPKYEKKTQLLIFKRLNSDQEVYNPIELQTNLQLINTYNEMITSYNILEKVVKNLNLNETVEELISKVNIKNEKNSQVITILVQDKNPKQAAAVANEISRVFRDEIISIMNLDNVTVLTKADATGEQIPVKPQPLLNIIVALVIGLFVGVVISFLMEYSDKTIRSEKDVMDLLELSVLGSIATNSNTINSRKFKTKKRPFRGGTID